MWKGVDLINTWKRYNHREETRVWRGWGWRGGVPRAYCRMGSLAARLAKQGRAELATDFTPAVSSPSSSSLFYPNDNLGPHSQSIQYVMLGAVP